MTRPGPPHRQVVRQTIRMLRDSWGSGWPVVALQSYKSCLVGIATPDRPVSSQKRSYFYQGIKSFCTHWPVDHLANMNGYLERGGAVVQDRVAGDPVLVVYCPHPTRGVPSKTCSRAVRSPIRGPALCHHR